MCVYVFNKTTRLKEKKWNIIFYFAYPNIEAPMSVMGKLLLRGQLPSCINKYFLELIHTCLCIVYGCFNATTEDLSG